MEKPFDSLGYKAMRIVIIHFIKPAIKAGERKIKARKICRWWRRASGHHEGFRLYKPLLKGDQQCTPPGSWTWHECEPNCCKKIPRHIIYNHVLAEMIYRRESWIQLNHWRHFWTKYNCLCTMRPAHIIIDYMRKYNHSATVYYILAGNFISPAIRMKVSNYLINRLCPK